MKPCSHCVNEWMNAANLYLSLWKLHISLVACVQFNVESKHLNRLSFRAKIARGAGLAWHRQHDDFQPGNSRWLFAKTSIDPWLDCSNFGLKSVCTCLWVSHWKLRGNSLNPHFSPNLGRRSLSWLKTYYYTNTITIMTGKFAGLLMIHCVWNFEASQIFVLSILLALFDSISDISDLKWPSLVYRWTVEIRLSLKITVQSMCTCWRLYACCYIFKQM